VVVGSGVVSHGVVAGSETTTVPADTFDYLYIKKKKVYNGVQGRL